MHGANRLGGNSLSDLLVFGKRAGEYAAKFDAEALAELRRRMQVTEQDDAQRQSFVTATAPVYDRAADLAGEKELGALRAATAAAAAGVPARASSWT